MRHAYLIMAHNEFDILCLLVSLLDVPSNDIYIHFDRKVKTTPNINVQKGRLFIIDERVDVRWGCISQIEAEFALLRSAYKKREYSHYFIISGTHLPLKDIKQINNFADNHLGESIFKIWEEDKGNIQYKFGKYHLFTKGCYSNNRTVARLSNLAWRFSLKVQDILGIKRDVADLIKADQWCILSSEAVSRLLSEESKIICRYKYTFCPDEYIMATELKKWRFPYLDYPFLLYTKFVGSRPITLNMSDWDNLKNTDYFFARKFSNN